MGPYNGTTTTTPGRSGFGSKGNKTVTPHPRTGASSSDTVWCHAQDIELMKSELSKKKDN